MVRRVNSSSDSSPTWAVAVGVTTPFASDRLLDDGDATYSANSSAYHHVDRLLIGAHAVREVMRDRSPPTAPPRRSSGSAA